MQGTPHIASTPHDGRLPSAPPAARQAQYTGRDVAQRAPHRVEAPPVDPVDPAYPVDPVARRPRPVDPQLPVFIDQSGWRRRALQGLGLVVGCAGLGYLLFAGTLISELWKPVGTQPPSTNAPAPTGQDGTGTGTRTSPQGRSDVRTGAAHADRDDHRRPPAGRSAPPAGGPKR